MVATGGTRSRVFNASGNLFGGDGDDTIFSNNGRLLGEAGDDTLVLEAFDRAGRFGVANGVVNGGAGNDLLRASLPLGGRLIGTFFGEGRRRPPRRDPSAKAGR